MEKAVLMADGGIGKPLVSYETINSNNMSSPDAHKWRRHMRMKKRRQSSEGSLIHITGTGTILEETLDCKHCYRGSPNGKENNESNQDLDELQPDLGQYDDFHTIDWQKDLSRDRFRHRYIVRKMSVSFWRKVKGYYDASSGWVCVFLVGVAAGTVAGIVDIGEAWMKDLKEGICPQAFWLNKEQCCWSSNETYYDGDRCDQWFEWSDFLRFRDGLNAPPYAVSYTVYVLWSLLFALLACTMVKTFAPYACGSGIPEIKTILSGFIMRGYLGKWTLLVKSVSIMLAVSAGLSLGKEGPLVHVVCCIGNIFSYLFPKYGKNEAKKREILSAAAASGVSVAFGAPIGGVLFSLEEVSYYFPLKTLWRSFFCALVAAFVLRSIDPFGNDHLVKYFMSDKRPWVFIELLPFVILGMLGGLVGTAFIRGNLAWCKFRKSSKLGQFPITEVLVVTLVTAVVSFPNEFTRMNASDLIKLLFSQCGINDVSPLCDYKRNMTSTEYMEIIDSGPGIYRSLYLLCLALLFKWIITIFTFGIRVPAGLFVPSMAMGAIMGRMIGIGMQELALHNRNVWPFKSMCAPSEECMSPGLYAMIGAAACLAGVTRMTVSLVVIMFELTGSVDYIVPLMATVVASKWMGDALHGAGIYEAHIRLNQYPYLDNKEEFTHSLKAADITGSSRLHRGPLCCLSQEGMTLDEIEQLLDRTNHNGFPVVVSKENPCLVGFVLRRDVTLALAHIRKKGDDINGRTPVCFDRTKHETPIVPAPIYLGKIVDMAPITVTVQTPMETIIEMFCKLGLRQILVTNNGLLNDIVTKKDVLNHIQALHKKAEMLQENDSRQ